jgi:hypothetical protein
MDERPQPEAITSGLETKSAKIRALAEAGYDRTEISNLLGIRYQHVRNVLVVSGITSGLRRQGPVRRSTADMTGASARSSSANAKPAGDFHAKPTMAGLV